MADNCSLLLRTCGKALRGAWHKLHIKSLGRQLPTRQPSAQAGSARCPGLRLDYGEIDRENHTSAELASYLVLVCINDVAKSRQHESDEGSHSSRSSRS